MISGNPLSRRHALTIGAIFFILVAAFIDPGLMYHLSCHVGIITIAFLIICAFLAAKGIGKLAEVFFRGAVRPWYARPGVVVFLCIILPCVNILFIWMDNMFIDIRAMGQVISQPVRMFMFMALELLWIAVLE